MSRTIRRKNTRNDAYTVPPWKIHGDMFRHINAPAWFRRFLNREIRSKNKAILIRWEEDLPFIPHRKNANWEYW